MVRLATPLYLYGGSGYAFNYVNDKSYYVAGYYGSNSYSVSKGTDLETFARDGVVADIGFVFRYRLLAFSMGYTHAFPVEYIYNNKHFNEVSFGIGFAFGRWGNK